MASRTGSSDTGVDAPRVLERRRSSFTRRGPFCAERYIANLRRRSSESRSSSVERQPRSSDPQNRSSSTQRRSSSSQRRSSSAERRYSSGRELAKKIENGTIPPVPIFPWKQTEPSDTCRYLLSSIENHSRRRYTRVVHSFTLWASPALVRQNTEEAYIHIKDAFVRTVRNWTVLTGQVRRQAPGSDSLVIEYAKTVDVESIKQRCRLQVLPRMDGSSSSIEETRRLSQGRINSDYFYQPEKLDDGGGVPPVTLTTTVFCNCVLFLGFSFCDSVFDAEFMGMFLTTFTRMTIETKLEPAGIVEGPRIGNFKFDSPDRDLFPFYDWIDAPIPQQLARSMLRCRCVTLDETVSCYAIDTVRSILFEQGRKDLVCNQDCIVALFWLTIMRVRLAAGLLKKPDQAQLNITLPGIPHIQRHSCVNKNARYWGNSNVTTTAKVGCQTLLHGFPDQCEGNDIILRQSMSANELASAACTIRRTIEQVDHTYVRKLMRLKQCVDRLEDEAAYHRGLKRDTTGVCFEDWSGCEVTRGTGIPHTKGSRAKFHRCDDDVEESKIVLLPCKSKGSWSIWLCLKQDEMERVMAQLAKDKWVKAPGDDSQTKPTLRMDRAAAAPAPR